MHFQGYEKFFKVTPTTFIQKKALENQHFSVSELMLSQPETTPNTSMLPRSMTMLLVANYLNDSPATYSLETIYLHLRIISKFYLVVAARRVYTLISVFRIARKMTITFQYSSR